jgi:hypothetical protein
MPFYTDDSQFYSLMQMLFDRLRQRTPNPIDNLTAARLIILMKIPSPEAEVLINGRQKPVSVRYGRTGRVLPDLDAEMTGDTLHKILTHELSLRDAWAKRMIKVKGSILKAAPLVDILRASREIYQDVLREQNLPG